MKLRGTMGTVAAAVTAFASVALVIVAWQTCLVVRTVNVYAEPQSIGQGERSSVRVELLGTFGWRVPGAHRSVTFAIEEGSECGVLEKVADSMSVAVRGIRPGDVVITARVEGILFPYSVTIRVQPLLAGMAAPTEWRLPAPLRHRSAHRDT